MTASGRSFSDAVVAYTGFGVDALPASHPERVAPPSLRAEVIDLFRRIDRLKPEGGDLSEWARAQAAALSEGDPRLDERARRAIVARLTWAWR